LGKESVGKGDFKGPENSGRREGKRKIRSIYMARLQVKKGGGGRNLQEIEAVESQKKKKRERERMKLRGGGDRPRLILL